MKRLAKHPKFYVKRALYRVLSPIALRFVASIELIQKIERHEKLFGELNQRIYDLETDRELERLIIRKLLNKLNLVYFESKKADDEFKKVFQEISQAVTELKNKENLDLDRVTILSEAV